MVVERKRSSVATGPYQRTSVNSASQPEMKVDDW